MNLTLFYMLILLLPGATTEEINTNSQCVPCLFSICYCVIGKMRGGLEDKLIIMILLC